MTKEQAITKLRELDKAFDDAFKESRFWSKEYRLAGSASTYVKASQKPVIETHYQRALNKQDLIWGEMEQIMDYYGIGVDDI